MINYQQEHVSPLGTTGTITSEHLSPGKAIFYRPPNGEQSASNWWTDSIQLVDEWTTAGGRSKRYEEHA